MKTCKQLAAEWGLTERNINYLCKNGKIKGAVKIGKSWQIPDDVEKPADGRMSSGKYIRQSAGEGVKPLPIGISDVARHVGVSRSQLYRLFVSELKLTPMQALTQVRIRHACALLRRGDLSVKAVAASVGFENPLYFSRRFHEIVGSPPTEYIRSK